MSQRQFIIYDLEATCWRSPKPRTVEIIEIGAVKVDENLEVIDEFCAFIKPIVHPKIDKFCTKLTSITQDDVEDAEPFDVVVKQFSDWMDYEETRTALFSWGEFDHRQFVLDARLHNLDLEWLKYWACLQRHYSKFKGSKNQIGLKNALILEGLEFNGVQHRAIADAQNMAKLFIKVAKPMKIV
ncbi:MAG TPA: exonuclease domain-containing protein [Flavobacteriales bacterium]|nr:exonuclease domain-containing protein [Flavobacteriales bacterium]HIO16453.1 exonuclease domain-containing protein [Flavobacteriales bacterium]